MDEDTDNLALLKLLAPFLAGTAVLTVAMLVVLFRFTSFGALATLPSVVSFDVVKYTNAQRAVASTFIKQDSDVAKASELLLNLPSRTREAIATIAGTGTLVVVKQAVVQGQTADITDAVLKKLGLPTEVPTADGAGYVIDSAPTMFIGGPKQPYVPPSASPTVLP